MATTNFTSGITIASSWLNDVDAVTYDFVYADHYATLQLALNTGKVVRLTDGVTYPITSQITIPTGGGLIGKGILTFSSTNFTATTNTISTLSTVIYALSVDNITLRDFKMVGTCAQNSYLFPIAIRDVESAQVSNIDISGLNSGACIKIDSSFDVKIQGSNFHDCTLDRTNTGQLTGVVVDDNRISSVGSERITITDNTFENLSWTAGFLASYGPQSDGVNIMIGSKHCVVSHNVFSTVGEGIDCFADDTIITDNITYNTLGFGIKLIHGASRNLISNNRIINSGLGGIVLAGSDSASQHTDRNTIINNVISGAGTNTGSYWAQPMYAIGIGNDGATYKVTNALVKDNQVISNTGSASYAYLAGGSGAGNVFDSNYFDNSGGSAYSGTNATMYAPNQFGGILTQARVATFTTSGVLIQTFNDNSVAQLQEARNWAITAANHGVERFTTFGVSSTLGATAFRERIVSTEDWSVAGNRSAKAQYAAAKDGSLVEIIELDPTKGLVIPTLGLGLHIKEGSNAKMGTVSLVGGTATVATTAVTASSRIFLMSQSDGGTPGWLRVTNRTDATSFVITSSSGTDTSFVAWILIEPV